MALQLFQPPLASSSSLCPSEAPYLILHRQQHRFPSPVANGIFRTPTVSFRCRREVTVRGGPVFVGKEDTELRASIVQEDKWQLEEAKQEKEEEEEEVGEPPSPQDLENVRQIKRVLELLRKNRDMLFGEVKCTIMIEDPREVERRRLLGIEDSDAPTRDDLVVALEEVNEGKVPKDRLALQMLAEEMINWPNLEVEAPKAKPSKSQYARATDTGVDPKEAARRLNIDWDSAAEIEETEVSDDTEVPPAVFPGKST